MHPGMLGNCRLLYFPRLVLAWCSLRRVPNDFLVSLIYNFSQLLHGSLYTTPVLLRKGSSSLTLVSCCQSVEMVENTVLISYLLHTLLRSSLTPDMYGKWIVYLGSSSRLFLLGTDNMVGVAIHSQDLCQMFVLSPDVPSYSHYSCPMEKA